MRLILGLLREECPEVVLEEGILFVGVEQCDLLVFLRSQITYRVISHLIFEFDFVYDVFHIFLLVWVQILIHVLVFQPVRLQRIKGGEDVFFWVER